MTPWSRRRSRKLATELSHSIERILKLAAVVAELRRSIEHIEELAADTPTPEDAERALDAIKGECERILSDT